MRTRDTQAMEHGTVDSEAAVDRSQAVAPVENDAVVVAAVVNLS
jgi:hypothetical protein